MYRISIDREACDGVFACLVRDDRFVESAEHDSADGSSGQGPREAGLAAIEVDGEHAIAGTFDDDRRGDAEQAAAACPLDAITVEDADPDAPRSQPLGEATK
ncbi:ferredoxin [Halobacteriales archaeon QH_8_67_36]|nr:MAG: ferredoxin [Halobacteriales archaeon QH_8_67_36]